MTHKEAARRPGGRSRSRRSALFMVTLDNLVVTTALPVIREDLHAGLSGLEWTVNAYTLTFAVLLLTGRRARRPLRARGSCSRSGSASSPLASAAAALAPTIGALDAARAVQGVGGAIVHAADADDPLRRRCRRSGAASFLGAWGGISGLAVAFGPLVGGAVVSGISWHWIFWLNVPIGLVLLRSRCSGSTRRRARSARVDLPGLVLASAGLFGIVWGLVRGNSRRLDVAGDRRRARRRRACSSPRSSRGSCAPSIRCCRCASSATARSRSRTSPRS